MRLATAALAATLLCACSPDYNWREIHANDQGYRVMLPDKPASMTRTIQLEDMQVSMTMQGARVGETSFTVAVAELPDALPATREKALAAMRAAMVRNIAGTERAAAARRVSVIDASGAAQGAQDAVRIDADGSAQGKAVTMLAGFAARGARAYQWVALGPGVDREQAQVFLDSFRLVQAGS